jgi:hypothetical protein
MEIRVPLVFLVISPQETYVMVDWLWRKRKKKKRSFFYTTPCMRFCELTKCFRVKLQTLKTRVPTAMCTTRLTLLGLLQNTDCNVHHETDLIRVTVKH